MKPRVEEERAGSTPRVRAPGDRVLGRPLAADPLVNEGSIQRLLEQSRGSVTPTASTTIPPPASPPPEDEGPAQGADTPDITTLEGMAALLTDPASQPLRPDPPANSATGPAKDPNPLAGLLERLTAAAPPAVDHGRLRPTDGDGPVPTERGDDPLLREGPGGEAPDAEERLRRVGVPASLLSGHRSDDPLALLQSVVQQLPAADPLPTGPGTVIAVVGDRPDMESVVTWVVSYLGLDGDDVAIASSRPDPDCGHGTVLVDPASASRFRSEAATERPALVIVQQDVGTRGTAWTRAVLEALDPHATWGAALAWRKPEDVGEWSRLLGGIDAIALSATADTTTPFSILATGLPVALIDGRRATPSRWFRVFDDHDVGSSPLMG